MPPFICHRNSKFTLQGSLGKGKSSSKLFWQGIFKFAGGYIKLKDDFPFPKVRYVLVQNGRVSLHSSQVKPHFVQGTRHPYLQEIPGVEAPMVLVPHHPVRRYCYYLGFFCPTQPPQQKKYSPETWRGKRFNSMISQNDL